MVNPLPPPFFNPHELALLRGWIAQLGWPLLGQLYLDGADITTTRQAVRQLRQRMAERARQGQQPAWEVFWRAERGTDVAWQRQAERALQGVLALPSSLPQPTDTLARWLAPQTAQKLMAAQLLTWQAVLDRRSQHGRGWWRGVPGLGASAARQVEQFLQSHPSLASAETLALVAIPTRPVPETSRFAELFAARPELSGRHGSNRAVPERCRLAAEDDEAAIQCWLNLRDVDSHTHRTYRKEAERFLLWAVAERGKPLSALDTNDCKAYRDFLLAPPAHWTTPTMQPRWSRAWRPLQGPCSARSLRHSETILASLCAWLVQQRYLDSNPFEGLPPLSAMGRPVLQVDHVFDERQWQWLLAYCVACEQQPPPHPERREYRRLWMALQLAYCTGLRLAELAAARFSDIRQTRRGGGQYWLTVIGKGRKQREVPLPPGLVRALQQYAAEREVVWGSDAPLLGKFRRDVGENGWELAETAFTPSGLHRVLRQFFQAAAQARRVQPSDDPVADAHDADVLAQASAHWLRHTHATHALAQGADILQVKENLGHASVATTSIYLHADRDRRHAVMEGLFQAETETNER
jgi:site-specific recombinase XerD